MTCERTDGPHEASESPWYASKIPRETMRDLRMMIMIFGLRESTVIICEEPQHIINKALPPSVTGYLRMFRGFV